MTIKPCIPKEWRTYSVRYKWKNTLYNIIVENPNGKNTGISKITVNDVEVKDVVRLEENSGVVNVVVVM